VHKVERFSEVEAGPLVAGLAELLRDAVHGGSSVGFLPPVSRETAEGYWREALREVAGGTRVLLVARDGAEAAGSVQLALATKQNGLHRAEVQKLLVHTRHRRRGLGRALMSAAEEAARSEGRTLLVLDTEEGSDAERLYARCGYTRAGTIPHYALNTEGALITTVVFYKLL
jgi:acetyltransferase